MFGKIFRGIAKFQFVTSSLLAQVPGPWQPIAAANAALMQAFLGAKKPTAEGQPQGVLIGANNPLPYVMGESYTEGVEVHRRGYGGKVGKVQNPYAFLARVLSCCGPINAMGATMVDHEPITLTGSIGTVQPVATGGYYEDFLFIDQQLGARPESDALAAPAGWGTPDQWSTSHKLSGMAAVAWSLKWDKDGQVFGGGQIPPLGKVVQGVKVYDPRLDSTFPGGSGSCALGNESTYVYSANPALHAGTYAYGRKVNGVPVFGGRLFNADSVDWAKVVAWANTCEANGWTVNGTIFEPGDKWANLKRICEAGGGEPIVHGGKVTFDFWAPRTPVATIGRNDLLAAPVVSKLGRGWKERHNTLVPRYRSADHQWNYVQADAVEVSAFLTADGEEKTDERQWDLVTSVDQVTELAIYDLYERREAGPIVLSAKPHLRALLPGDCVTLLAELGAHPDGEITAVVSERPVDLATGGVALVLQQETAAKHTAALGAAGGAPVTVTLPSAADIDEAWVVNTAPVLKLENETDSSSGEITTYGTWVQVASKTGVAPDGGVLVWVSAGLTVHDNCQYKARILCDGTQVGIVSGPRTVKKDDQDEMTFSRAHTPSAGVSHTWTVEVQTNNRGITVNDPQIQILLKS